MCLTSRKHPYGKVISLKTCLIDPNARIVKKSNGPIDRNADAQRVHQPIVDGGPPKCQGNRSESSLKINQDFKQK